MSNHIDQLFVKEEPTKQTSISFHATPEEREALKAVAKVLDQPMAKVVRSCYLAGMEMLKVKAQSMNGAK